MAALAVAALGALGCAAPSPSVSRSGAVGTETAHPALTALITDLYVAFSFDANGEADWDAQRAVFAEGATFFSPIAPGGQPVGVDGETFLRDFKAFIATSPLGKTGYHERVIHTRIDRFGTIAHAWVTFEAFVPGEEPDRRGVDSIEFMLDGDAWKLVSFTTQYESNELSLPTRFLPN